MCEHKYGGASLTLHGMTVTLKLCTGFLGVALFEQGKVEGPPGAVVKLPYKQAVFRPVGWGGRRNFREGGLPVGTRAYTLLPNTDTSPVMACTVVLVDSLVKE